MGGVGGGGGGGWQLEQFVTGLMDPNQDAAAFQTLARDFLIQLKEFNSDQWTECSLSLQLEQQHKEAERVQVRRRALPPGVAGGGGGGGAGGFRQHPLRQGGAEPRRFTAEAHGLCGRLCRAASMGSTLTRLFRRRSWRGCRCRA